MARFVLVPSGVLEASISHFSGMIYFEQYTRDLRVVGHLLDSTISRRLQAPRCPRSRSGLIHQFCANFCFCSLRHPSEIFLRVFSLICSDWFPYVLMFCFTPCDHLIYGSTDYGDTSCRNWSLAFAVIAVV